MTVKTYRPVFGVTEKIFQYSSVLLAAEQCLWLTTYVHPVAYNVHHLFSPAILNSKPQPVMTTCRLALARCGRSSSVQAHHHSPPVSPQQGAKVPNSLMCHCLGYRWSSASALSTPSPAGCTALSTNNTRPSGVLCRWTNRLEFTSRRA